MLRDVVAQMDPDHVPLRNYAQRFLGYFRDPDGHVWEVAHNPGFTLGADGTLELPDFGS